MLVCTPVKVYMNSYDRKFKVASYYSVIYLILTSFEATTVYPHILYDDVFDHFHIQSFSFRVYIIPYYQQF